MSYVMARAIITAILLGPKWEEWNDHAITRATHMAMRVLDAAGVPRDE